MKHQQISVDFISMVSTAWSYVALAGAVWIFLRLVQACFWLPRHLQRHDNVQRMLQDKVESYEKYILECEEKEKIEQQQNGDDKPDQELQKKWKDRRECLQMLKRELSKAQSDKDDLHDWSYFLDDEETEDDVDSQCKNIEDVKTNTNTTKQKVYVGNKKGK